MRRKNIKDSTTILHGIILPVKWDKNGKVMRISLNAPDEKVYTIDYSGPGKELLRHIREMIKVEGIILQKLNGSLYVKVKNYNVVSALN